MEEKKEKKPPEGLFPAFPPNTGENNHINMIQYADPVVNQQVISIAKGKGVKRKITTNDIEAVLSAMHITVRYNVITSKMEITGIPVEYSDENAANVLPVLISDWLKENGFNTPMQTIYDALVVIMDKNRYNPVEEMLKKVRYDGIDRLKECEDILGLSKNDQGRKLFRKWMHQTVSMALNNESNPYGADGVLVLQGDQGAGKTLFLKTISVDPDLFAEGVSIDLNSKDSVIQSTSVWIAELGELDSTLKREQSSLKAFLTARCDTYRVPYAKVSISKIRRTSFGATVNPSEFLNDETGSRRFWVIHVDNIDTEKLKRTDKKWVMQLWAQVYEQLYLSDPQGFRLTPEERTELQVNNQVYAKKMPGELEITDRLNFDLDEKEWYLYSTCDVMSLLNIRGVSSSQVGKVLSKIAKSNKNVEVKNIHNIRFYKLPKLPDLRN